MPSEASPALWAFQGCKSRHRSVSAGHTEGGKYADGTRETVEVGAVDLGEDRTADPAGDRVGEVLLFGGPGSSETDLRQQMGENRRLRCASRPGPTLGPRPRG
jgi:hypothetical protein